MSPRALLRLYPRTWRERYADEMLALIEVQPLRARDWLELTAMLCHAWYRALNMFLLLEPVTLALFAIAIGSGLRMSGIMPPRLGEVDTGLTMGLAIFNFALCAGIGWQLLRRKRKFGQGLRLPNREAFGGVLLVLAITLVRAWIESKPLWKHFVFGPGGGWLLVLYGAAEFNQARDTFRPRSAPNVPANPLGLA